MWGRRSNNRCVVPMVLCWWHLDLGPGSSGLRLVVKRDCPDQIEMKVVEECWDPVLKLFDSCGCSGSLVEV